jgi:hypothetical protein
VRLAAAGRGGEKVRSHGRFRRRLFNINNLGAFLPPSRGRRRCR